MEGSNNEYNDQCYTPSRLRPRRNARMLLARCKSFLVVTSGSRRVPWRYANIVPRPTNSTKQIKTNFGISEAHVVYDQPPDFFRPPDLPERHALFKRLAKTSPDFAETVRLHTAAMTDATAAAANFGGMHASSDEGLRASSKQARRDARRGASNAAVEDAPEVYGSQNNGDDGGMKVTSHGEREAREERTLFTTRSAEDVYELRRDRPALLVSSTSWTPDEDFSVLLEALERFDSRAASGASPTLPFVVVIVTGKGPQKEEYVKRMKEASMSRVAVCTAWLEPDDYPVLLGSADLGICLHTSTSGEQSISFCAVCYSFQQAGVASSR